MPVYAVPCDQLTELNEMVKPPHCSDKHLYNLVNSFVAGIMDGKVQAKFYTDTWPHFTCLVVAVTMPRISEVVDLYTHSHDQQKLARLLKEAGLITWGKMQVISMGVDHIDHAKSLMSAVNPVPNKYELKIIHHGCLVFMPDDVVLDDMELPGGYKLGKLEPQHAERVASNVLLKHVLQAGTAGYVSPYNLVQMFLTPFFERVIKNFETFAIFTKDDPSAGPVAWTLIEPNRRMGHMYTMAAHRHKGLAGALLLAITRHERSVGEIPVFVFEIEDFQSPEQSFGFQKVCESVMLVHPGERPFPGESRL